MNDTEKRVKKLLKEREGEYIEEKDIFHASMAGMCPRIIYLEKTNPIKPDYKLEKIFLIGHIFHDFFEENLYKDYECEKRLSFESDGVKISGKADAYNDEEVIDFKTCKDTKWIYEPKPEHMVQINIYMKMLNLDSGRLIYIGKTDLDLKEFTVKYDDELFKEILKKLKDVTQKIKEKADVKDVSASLSKNCIWCKYNKFCFPK